MQIVATELPRLIQCGGSFTMPGFTPGMEDESNSRKEGNAAHWLACEGLRHGASTVYDYVNRKAPNGTYITEEMVDIVFDYVVALDVRTNGGKFRFVETDRVINGPHNLQIACRPDWVEFDQARNIVYIDDLKYGWRLVEAYENWVLIAYAISHVFTTSLWNEQTSFVMRIHQPRPYHIDGSIREYTLTLPELRAKSDYIFAALLNNSGLQSGPECHNCPSLGNCPAARQAGMNAIDVASKAFDENLPNSEIDYELDQLDRALKMIQDRREALAEIAEHRLKSGQQIPNRFMKSNETPLKWLDHATPEMLRKFTNTEIMKKPEMKTPTQLIKAGVPEAIVLGFAKRFPGKSVLAKIDTHKQAMRLLKSENK